MEQPRRNKLFDDSDEEEGNIFNLFQPPHTNLKLKETFMSLSKLLTIQKRHLSSRLLTILILKQKKLHTNQIPSMIQNT